MPPYLAIQEKYLWVLYGLGVGITLVIILARGSLRFSIFPWQKRDHDPADDIHEFGDVSEGQGRVPVLIWLVFIGWGLWATGYVIFRSLDG